MSVPTNSRSDPELGTETPLGRHDSFNSTVTVKTSVQWQVLSRAL